MGLRSLFLLAFVVLAMIPFAGSMAFITEDLYDDEIFANFFIACKYKFNEVKMKTKKFMKIAVLGVVFALLIIPVSASLADSDGDLYTDDFEELLGTNPEDPGSRPECCGGGSMDSNGNGIPDYVEELAEQNKITGAFSLENIDTELDTDGDGIEDFREFYYYGTDPEKVDTDGDGVSDYDEISKNCCFEHDADNDGDGCTNLQEFEFGTDLNNPEDYHESCFTGAAVSDTEGDSTTLPLGSIVFAALIASAIGFYFISNRKRRI